jgi:hypothetical protein
MLDLKQLYRGFREGKIREIVHGLRQPKKSEEYKWAKETAKTKAKSWGAAISVPLIAATLVGSCMARNRIIYQDNPVNIITPEPLTEILDPLEPLEKYEPLEDYNPLDFNNSEKGITTDNLLTDPINHSREPFAGYDNTPEIITGVAPVKSPVIFKGIIQGRGPGAREGALKKYGAPHGSDKAVIRALRWLKINQLYDGSWSETKFPEGKGSFKPAMTGLALLTYLAHGETPASEEFGETIQKGLQWLINNQKNNGRFNFADGNDYSLPIATYALSEAFTMTKIPTIKDAAEKSIQIIIAGQNPNGAFNYNCFPGGMGRNDTSYSGWCIQALKAAKLAKLEVNNLDLALEKAIQGIKANYANKNGYSGFGYANPDVHSLTGVGILSLQLLGASNHKEAKNSLPYLMQVQTKKWDTVTWVDLYHWYYNIQAAFHEGGNLWKKWNSEFLPLIAKNQVILKNKYEDNKDIGYWSSSDSSHGLVYDTTMATLMLEVYYRYLPTFQNSEIEKPEIKSEGEIKIDITKQ